MLKGKPEIDTIAMTIVIARGLGAQPGFVSCDAALETRLSIEGDPLCAETGTVTRLTLLGLLLCSLGFVSGCASIREYLPSLPGSGPSAAQPYHRGESPTAAAPAPASAVTYAPAAPYKAAPPAPVHSSPVAGTASQGPPPVMALSPAARTSVQDRREPHSEQTDARPSRRSVATPSEPGFLERIGGAVAGWFSWLPFGSKAQPQRPVEAPLSNVTTRAASKAGNLEVVAPLWDPAALVPRLEEALRRRGFEVGVITGPAPLKTQRAPNSLETDSQSSLTSWSFHYVPTHTGPDARATPGVVTRGYRAPQRARLHFEYELDASQREPDLVRLNATLIDADAGTVIGHMAFSGKRGIDSVLSDVAGIVTRSLR